MPIFLLAQDRDLLNVSYAVSTLKYSDTVANANLFDLKLKLPVLQKKDNAIVGIVGYKNLSLQNLPADYTGNLHGISLDL